MMATIESNKNKNRANSHASSAWNDELGGALADINFRRRRTGGYQRGKVTLTLEDAWPTLIDRRRNRPDRMALDEKLGQPGMWKRVVQGKSAIRLFELPPEVTADHHDPDATGFQLPALAQCARWAIDSLNGEATPNWSPPPREMIDGWIDRSQLTIRDGHLARQVQVVHEDSKLALVAPIATAAPNDLPESRSKWLDRLLIETQNRWRMVRVGFVDNDDGSTRAAVAEVDLSGAPHLVLEVLLVTALESLRCAVQWSVQTAELLTDSSVRVDALDRFPLTP